MKHKIFSLILAATLLFTAAFPAYATETEKTETETTAGSGKTTLVNLISRFYDASKGTVLLDGQNIENYTRSDLRSRIGVVPQKAALFKGSIRDNLKWGREDASDEDLWQALTTAQGKEVVVFIRSTYSFLPMTTPH